MEEHKEHEHRKQGNKNLYILIAVAAFVIVVAALLLFVYASPTAVAIGDNVSVYYTGALSNGTVFGSNIGQQPLVFIAGSNQLIQGFSQGVVGMHVNQTKRIVVPPEEGYGQVNPALFAHVPRSQFGNQTPEVGMTATTISNGQEIQGTIIQVNATNVTVDFNPPLAGQTLVFNVTVVKIAK